jgi:hypothetical protein
MTVIKIQSLLDQPRPPIFGGAGFFVGGYIVSPSKKNKKNLEGYRRLNYFFLVNQNTMASKQKKSPHPLNEDGFHATSIKLPIATYTALKDIAEKEKRPVTRQAEVFIEAGIKSAGV